jgi:hypothetical protein
MYARTTKPAVLTANRIAEGRKARSFNVSREPLLLGSLLALLTSRGAGAG